MSLSDQIKQPGQIVGAGGGGGGSNDAGDLTTGTLPAARLPGVLENVDTQPELLSAAGAAAASHNHAASDVTSGVFDPARLGTGTANSSKFLRGDGAWEAPSGGGSAVACQVYKSNSGGDQSVSASTYTDITFDSESLDTDSMHSTSSNTARLTAPSNGKYIFGFTITAQITAGGNAFAYAVKNGTRLDGTAKYIYSSELAACITFAMVLSLSATDYMTVQLYTDATTTVRGQDAYSGRGTSAFLVRIGD